MLLHSVRISWIFVLGFGIDSAPDLARDYIIIVQLAEKDNSRKKMGIIILFGVITTNFCCENKALRKVRKMFSAVLYMELLCMPVDLMH